MSAYTLKNLMETKDMAAEQGFGEAMSARFPYGELGCEQLGFSLQELRPNVEAPFGHTHNEAEEVYVVLAGSGRVRLDDDVQEIKPLDALRVAPDVMRAFAAGPDGLRFLVFSVRREGDSNIRPEPWS
jgi:quercetin dioxygenase-like cupin family protein